MVFRFHQLKMLSLAFSLVLLSGCAVQEINKMGQQARDDGNTASRLMRSKMALSQPTVTWTDKPWVNLTPISRSPVIDDDKSVPDCQITINRPDGISLPEIGQRISTVCGFGVSISPDAFATQSTGSGGYIQTQPVSGKLPEPTDNGRVALGAISAQSAGQVQSAGNSLQQIIGLKWDRDVRGLLDIAGSRFGLSWRMENGRVLFYRYDTQTFQLAILNTKVDSSASIDSGAGAQMGGTGTSGTSGEANSAQKTKYDLNTDLYGDLRKTIENMLTPQTGRYWLSSSSGTLTVTDTPEVIGRVGRFVDYENKVLNRQVQLNIQVLSVTQTHNEELGLDWDLVYSSLKNYGVDVKGAFANASTGATSVSGSVLDGATGNARHFAGSNLIVKALSEQGDVSVVTSQSRLTTNFTPVPYQLSNQQGMLTSSSTTATANVGVTASQTTTTLTTGLFMTAVPSIEENGNVQLQFAFSYDSPPKITSFYSSDGNTRNDTADYSKEAITQKFNMRTGQTVMVTGADQVTNSADRQGVGSADFFALGGGRNGTRKRTTLVILITPILQG